MIKNTNSHKIIVSFASKGREDYNKGQQRLYESILKHWDGDYWLHSLERDGALPNPEDFESKTHQQLPYFFKFVMIELAREKGYTEIYWLDSSLVLERNITGLARPILCFDNLGHPLENYIADHAIENMNLNIESIRKTPQIWGGAIGFDFTQDTALEAYEEILTQAFKGSFHDGGSVRPEFIAHRHDQAVMSAIFYQHDIAPLSYGNIVTHPHYLPPYEYGEAFCISHRPI